MPLAIIRFIKYSLVGGTTFLLDLSLLTIMIDRWEINYLIASGSSFLLAVSINYFLSRKYVFKGSDRGLKTGYMNFLLIAMMGLSLVVGGMYVLVSWLALNYMLSRVIVAMFSGFWNYLLNLYVNFQVAGKY